MEAVWWLEVRNLEWGIKYREENKNEKNEAIWKRKGEKGKGENTFLKMLLQSS